MNELISLTQSAINGELQQTVNARDLHAFLEVGRDFSNWIKGRIYKYGFEENVDYVIVENLSSPDLANAKARPQKLLDYYISIDMAKELSMIENNDKGRDVRRYFIQCEKQLKSSQQVISSDESKMRALSFIISQTSLSDVAKESLLITTAETALGFPINYRPQLEQKTYTATQIGEQLGISSNKVGKLANAHNLKTEKYGMYVLDKARGHDKQVETFRYYKNIIPVLKAVLESKEYCGVRHNDER